METTTTVESIETLSQRPFPKQSSVKNLIGLEGKVAEMSVWEYRAFVGRVQKAETGEAPAKGTVPSRRK